MSSIFMQKITSIEPEEKCTICQFTQAETPEQKWVGHSLSEKIIEDGKEIEKLKWAHNFHKECLVETAKADYLLCPGACGNNIDLSSILSLTERAAIITKKSFKRAAVGAALLSGDILAMAPAVARTGSITYGLATLMNALTVIILAGSAWEAAGRRPEVLLGGILAPTLLGALLGDLELGLLITTTAIIKPLTMLAAVFIANSLGVSENAISISLQTETFIVMLAFLVAIASRFVTMNDLALT